MAGDEVRDHLQRNVFHFLAERIENTAPNGFVVRDGLVMAGFCLPAARIDVQVIAEHLHELIDGRVGHAAVMPRAGAQRFAAKAFKAAVVPVHNGKIGLTDPAVAPYTLEEGGKPAVPVDVRDHLDVVIKPHHMEVVEGVLHAAPLTVLVKTGLVLIQLAEPALTVGLAVPEIMGELFIGLYIFGKRGLLEPGYFEADFRHITYPPGSS